MLSKRNERSSFIEEIVSPVLSDNSRMQCSCTYIGDELVQYQVKIVGYDHVSCSINHDGSDISVTVVGLKLIELAGSYEDAFEKYLGLCDGFNGNNHSISVMGKDLILTQYHHIESFDRSRESCYLCTLILDALDDIRMANNFVTGECGAI